jgi:hypothetical protein
MGGHFGAPIFTGLGIALDRAPAPKGTETVARKCKMAIDTQGGFPEHEDDEESTTGTSGTTLGTTTLESTTTTGDGHPPRLGE